MVYVPWLADAARTTGYRVVEVSGWRSRGHGPMRLVEGVVGHHTATPASARGNYPSLNVVTNGRAGLPGPLCNLGLGRDGTIYVVAAGLAYHAGASAWSGFWDLNDEFLGIEAESPGDGTWTAAQRDCYPKLVGALLRYMHRDKSRYGGHKDVCRPRGRKIDPAGGRGTPGDLAWMQNTADRYRTGGGGAAGGGDMPSAEEVAKAVWTHWILNRRYGKKEYAETLLGSSEDRIIRQQLAPLRAQVGELVRLVGQREAVTAEDIAAALRAGLTADLLPVLREVVGEALGDDNTETADAIADSVLDRLGARLQEDASA